MARQPNVVVFFTDQQRWDASSLHGNPLDLMPGFDRIAARGTHLFNCTTCAPVCGPARACLQTGTYITTNGTIANGRPLTRSLPSLADCFRDGGYHTGYIGKWHLAPDSGVGAAPESSRGGYEYWLGANALEATSNAYDCIVYDNDDRSVKLPGYRVDALVDAMIRYIDDRARHHGNQPFFLFSSFLEPHFQNHLDDCPPPMGYREQYAGRWTPPDLAALPHFGWQDGGLEQRLVGGLAQQHLGGYWGMIKRLDEAFGRVLDALRSLELLDSTIVLFTSDHGCHFRTRSPEYKRTCHESSVRIPTALCGPGFDGGGCVQHATSLVDLPPTLLDACGLGIPDVMEGRSVLPLLRGDIAGWPGESFIQVCDDQVGRAIRTARWKYCVMSDRPAGAVGRDFSDVVYRETYLYDLACDPYELTNLIACASHGAVRAWLRERLTARMHALGEPEPRIELVEPRPSGQRRVDPGEMDPPLCAW